MGKPIEDLDQTPVHVALSQCDVWAAKERVGRVNCEPLRILENLAKLSAVRDPTAVLRRRRPTPAHNDRRWRVGIRR